MCDPRFIPCPVTAASAARHSPSNVTCGRRCSSSAKRRRPDWPPLAPTGAVLEGGAPDHLRVPVLVNVSDADDEGVAIRRSRKWRDSSGELTFSHQVDS